jgi:tight adherence protein B
MTSQVLLVLLSMPVLSGVLLLWIRRKDRRRQFVSQRLKAVAAIHDNSSQSTVRLQRQGPAQIAFLQLPRQLWTRLDTAFAAAGHRLGLLHLLASGIIAAIIVMFFTSQLLSLNFSLVLLFTGAATAVTPYLVLQLMQARYRRHFLDIFPDALDLIRRGVKAGLPVNEALAVAGREIADPVGKEFRTAVAQSQIGVQIIDALQQTANRVRVADFRFLVVTLALQAKTGGSLAETLASLSTVIRARKALRLKARALSAEAKASAAVLASLPFVVWGFMYLLSRDMALDLIVDPRGRFMVGIAFLSLVTGLSTMAWIVRRALR